MQGTGPNGAAFAAHLSRKGTGTAFTELLAGKADIGTASRRINQDEVSKLSAVGQGDYTQPGQENVLALDGLLAIVSKKNKVNAIKISDMRDIYAGRITDWSQVGGDPGPIHVFTRDTHSGTYDSFNALVMSGTPIDPSILAKAVADSNEMSEKVQGDSSAIGYAGFAYLGGNKALKIITDCGTSFPPWDLFVRTEEYPLSRRLYLYLPRTPSDEARSFVDFALSDKGQELARKKNFIDLIPQLAPLSYGRDQIALAYVDLLENNGSIRLDFDRFGAYARRIIDGQRVSTTFRFDTDSAELDSRAVRDIDRLADYLKAASGQNILIAGFADTDGDPAYNVTLSKDRATHVAQLLRDKGVEPTDVQGYGRVSPVACNTTPEGRQKNRRVEVWLY